MARYIDADPYDKLLEQREKALWEIDALPVADAVSQCRKLLSKQPTIDAVEVVHSRWEEPFLHGIFVCRNCYKSGVAHLRKEKTSYCPDCGAKMDLEDDHGR